MFAFRPKDEDDGIRVAQVMGSRKYWLPLLMNELDRDRHEFFLVNARTGEAVISWIDTPLPTPARPPRGLYLKAA